MQLALVLLAAGLVVASGTETGTVVFRHSVAHTESELGSLGDLEQTIADRISAATGATFDVADVTVTALDVQTTLKLKNIADVNTAGIIKELVDTKAEIQALLDDTSSGGGTVTVLDQVAFSKIEILINPYNISTGKVYGAPIYADTEADGIVSAYTSKVSPKLHDATHGMSCYAFTGEWKNLISNNLETYAILDGSTCF